ncbi:MAG: hypothetical protein WC076_03090, partial [Terrimicrobiaceae bacterium]
LEIVPLRFLMRHRPEMLGDSARQLQLMQKTLAETNIKIQHDRIHDVYACPTPRSTIRYEPSASPNVPVHRDKPDSVNTTGAE